MKGFDTMIYGYMRISTQKDKQTTDRQRLTLEQYAKENGFELIKSEENYGTVKRKQRNISDLKNKMLRK